jgi:hypothetical protein
MSLVDDIQASLERSPSARRNFQLARAAVRHTNEVLSDGPENSVAAATWSTFVELFGKKTDKQIAVQKMRDSFKRGMPSKVIRLSTLPLIAAAAGQIKTGRCGEFAAVAFEYLRRVAVSGADRFEMAACPHHWIVVIGRSPGTELARPAGWNRDAVVADAWDGTWYFGTSYSLHRPSPPWKSVRFPGADDEANTLTIGDWDSW